MFRLPHIILLSLSLSLSSGIEQPHLLLFYPVNTLYTLILLLFLYYNPWLFIMATGPATQSLKVSFSSPMGLVDLVDPSHR